jgi:ABC-2 type transport system permease protein
MSWTRLLAIMRKEVLQIIRDSRSLMIVIIMPAVLVLLFGYGVNLDQKGVPIYIWNQDGSQQSRNLIQRFQASKYFKVAGFVSDEQSLTNALDDGQARMVVVIPWNFSGRLFQGGATQIQTIVDATDDNSANLLMGYTQGVVQSYSSDVQVVWLHNRGFAAQFSPINIETRTWYNEELESSAFIIPGVLALVMSVIGAFLTSLTIAREWERGTMEQLISTPVSAIEIMLGKLTPYFILGMIDTIISASIAIFWFKVPFRGSYFALFATSSMFLVAVLSLGFLISVLAKSQFAASQIALLVTFLPTFLLSGFLFAIEQMPIALQWITRILPARYYVSLLKKIFLKGTPASSLYPDLIPLVLFAVVLTIAATSAFHKRLT